ncbi:transglycosylase SLT domain-containing protein [Chryseolinea sp. T2]|uniref:transglycosylase SLT domain-containing protein n=1 Tax=Chryseolinea sp. T2 TaxID=3129255 RepID=UPI00307872A3
MDASVVASASPEDTTLLIVEPDTRTFTLQSPPPRLRRPFQRKKLSVLSMHSINSFFLVDGEEQGLEYELVQLYAKDRGLEIEINTVENYREMYDSIAGGNFDLVMGTLFINAAMDSVVHFTKPLYYADVVMVSTDEVKDKNGREPIRVIHHSPVHFWMREQDTIISKLRDSIEHLGTDLSKELALERVARNKLSRLVVDRNEFLIMHAFFPQLQEHAVIKRQQPIGFAFNKYSMSLQSNFNDWYDKNHKSKDYQYIVKKYQDHSVFMKEKLRFELPSIRQGVISHYDSMIKRHAKTHDFDWKLIAAIIHQESRFRPTIVSPVGAYGLMQLMPSVAKTYHINFTRLSSPTLNIATGTKYFRWIYNHFDKPEYSSDDKIKFSLAAYNAGIGHVMDAKALATKYQLNPYVWDGNVEDMLLKKGIKQFYDDPVVKFGHCRGFETQVYVRNIMQYYEHYRNFLPVEGL